MTVAWSALEFLTVLRERRDVSLAGRALLSVLVSYASTRDGTCYPTQTTLADALGMTERAVRRVLTELGDLGLLLIQRRGPTSNVYRLRADRTVRKTGPWGPVKTGPYGPTNCP